MHSSQVSHSVLSMLRTVLRPLIRLLIRNGISYQVFCDECKSLYIDVADKEFREAGKKQTTAKIAMLTGINRKEVSKQQNSEATVDATPSWERKNRGARIVLAWSKDPDFLDENGQPLILSTGSADAQFSQLVKRYGLDISAGAILEELQRIGAVTRLADGRVQLSSITYMPQTGDHEKLWILGTSASDLIRTFNHNLEQPHEQAWVQRYVYYDNIPQEMLPLLRLQSKTHAQSFVTQIDEWLRVYDRDQNAEVEGQGKMRVGMGIYYFENDVSEDKPN